MRILSLIITLVLIATPAVGQEFYAHDIPTKNPKAFRNYQESLRRSVPSWVWMEEWVGDLEGVAIPLERSQIDRKTVFTGWVCKPHDCLMNKVYLIVDQSRVAALIDIADARPYFVGQMSPGEKSCLLYMQQNATERC